MMFRGLIITALAAFAAAQETPTLVQALNSTADLSSLNQIITSNQDLATTLGGLTNFTILAPNNAALEAFTSANNASLGDANFLAATIIYHVVDGTYANFTANNTFVSTALTSDVPGGYVNLTNPQVVEAQVINGTVSFVSGYKQVSTAVGNVVTVQNGVVHIIDSVLTLPASISSTATELGLSNAVAALLNTSLVETVDTTPDLTIFVPNNEAFQNISSALPTLTTEQLAEILTYHVVNGSVLYSTDLTNTSVTSLQGNSLNITVYNSSAVYVNNARVVTPDVLVANGVVHVIDEVLNPNSTATIDEPNFPGASSSGSVFPSQTDTPTSSRGFTTTAGPSVTSSSAPGAAWMVKPTGLGAAILAGVVLAL